MAEDPDSPRLNLDLAHSATKLPADANEMHTPLLTMSQSRTQGQSTATAVIGGNQQEDAIEDIEEDADSGDENEGVEDVDMKGMAPST